MQKTWIRIVNTVLTLTMMGLIFFFSTEGAVESDATSGILSRSILKVIRPDFEQLPEEERINLYNQVQTVVRKTAHFTEFMLLGLFLRCCLESWFGPGVPALGPIALGGGAAYAALDEWHQTLVDGRAGQWRDVGIDSAGVLVGVLLAALLIRRVANRQKKG